ncbi:MAG: LLM class flavin-dependent oxidoreductase [Candidatus Methanofastidiosia archaeon]
MVDIHEIKVGTLAPFLFPFDKSMKTAKRIEEIGYDSMWYADHLMGFVPESIWTPDITPLAMFQNSPHTFPDPFTLMAAHSAKTSRILLGTSVTDTIRRHPAVFAQTALTLDNISKGRVIFGVGAGEIENIEPYGLDFSEPVSRLEENLKIIRLLWSDQVKKKNFEGKFTSLKDAVLTLEPCKKGKYPPIWLGAMGRKMLKLTGELADGWLPISLNLPDTYELYEKNLNIVRKSAGNAGRDPDSLTAGLYAMTLVAKTHEECHELFKKPLARAWALATSEEGPFSAANVKHPFSTPNRKFNALLHYVPTRYSKEQILEAMNKIPEEVLEYCLFHGTRDEILEKVEKLAKVGLQHIVFWNLTGMIEPTRNKESLEIIKSVLNYIKDY